MAETEALLYVVLLGLVKPDVGKLPTWIVNSLRLETPIIQHWSLQLLGLTSSCHSSTMHLNSATVTTTTFWMA